MKPNRVHALTLALAGLALVAFTLRPQPGALEIGSPAPLTDLEMQGVSDATYTLGGVAGENGLLVLFSCNTCPWVARWEDRYPVIAELAEELGIGMIAVNSNAGSGYREKGDGFEDMEQRAAEKGYTFPYVLDENAQLAEAFGATRTPEIFLFNEDLLLAYHGAIDDNAAHADAVENPYLANAMQSMVEGEAIDPPVTRSTGCGIKFP